MSRTEIITIEHRCTCGVGCQLSGGDLRCSRCGEIRAVKVGRDPHPSADSIPQLGGALPWRESEATARLDGDRFYSTLGRMLMRSAITGGSS